MKLDAIRAAEEKLLLPTYERNPILFVSGQGVSLFDESGVEYLDLLSGIGVNALGYAHPATEAAISAQSRKLLHTSNLFFHEGQAELASRLTAMTGLDRVFFCNSGAEAFEAALKLARAYAKLRASEGTVLGTKILALEHGFHGRTMGAVSATHKQKYREPYEPLLAGVEFVRFDDVDDLRAKFSADVCAVCIEPIQGEGGIRPVSQEFFAAARELTSGTGALLIADEIQSGMGRTGKWCAYQHYGILPDITTLAKPLAGGLPLGAMLCTEEASRAMKPGLHGTTFGGGPLACAVAIAVIEEIKRADLLAHVSEVGEYFLAQLRALGTRHECVVDVRGTGLMIGIEFNDVTVAKTAAEQMFARRIIVNRTHETVLRFLPPYILEKRHVDRAISALDEILSQSDGHSAGAAMAGSSTSHG